MIILIKIALLIFMWYLFTESGKTISEWVLFWEDKETGEQHKCKREDYLELKELTQKEYQIYYLDTIFLDVIEQKMKYKKRAR